jgi:gas vesicle protein
LSDADIDDAVSAADADREQAGSFGAFAAGLMLGAVLGAGVALLMAPHTGDEARRLLGRRARRIGVRVADRVDDLRDDIRRGARKGERRLRKSLNL